MNLELQDVYDQLTSLDPAIRRWALEPVTDPNNPIGINNWDMCLYGQMALSVARHLGQPTLPEEMNLTITAELLRLPPDNMLYVDWDQATSEGRNQLRQAISAFYLAELRQHDRVSLIAEIEAMGDPLAAVETESTGGAPSSVTIERRDLFASATAAVTFILALFAR